MDLVGCSATTEYVAPTVLENFLGHGSTDMPLRWSWGICAVGARSCSPHIPDARCYDLDSNMRYTKVGAETIRPMPTNETQTIEEGLVWEWITKTWNASKAAAA